MSMSIFLLVPKWIARIQEKFGKKSPLDPKKVYL